MERLWKNEGATGRKRFEPFKLRNRLNKPNLSDTCCYRLPPKSHGKQGVCRGLPPVAGGPLPAREEVDLLKRQVLRTRRPTGLDRATLTREGVLVKPHRGRAAARRRKTDLRRTHKRCAAAVAEALTRTTLGKRGLGTEFSDESADVGGEQVDGVVLEALWLR
jgi:hypothetical protein